ncbi:hypothetical protein TPHA_0K02140 [Tetrapisispora phaffii CBS 4417]|uniref:Nitrogen permease regulator 3 n=1 Tax=Tetrapisispora phaffii (strain ATCC 24235 / CBS 4417 / NBRC 1672 / NRRL Y-8282 / UCD 70-5) TaxID=1071381 RepID=G8BZL7_TETPH|nr:hypothetical protein TPHA_0K02140 [Tetrapisispora phaffii CBS 4417]CCE65345.1 hypothetical protein TPHA_0K02140 [Tetrapisispora phaffii CBS 4417]
MKQKHYLPDSRLVGIQLTVSTHSGPQVIFHYPPCSPSHLSNKRNKHKKVYPKKAANTLLTPVDSMNKSTDLRLGKQRSIDNNSAHMSIPSLKTNFTQSDLVPDNDRYLDNFDSTSDSDISSGLSDSEISTDNSDMSSFSSNSSDENEQLFNNRLSNYTSQQSGGAISTPTDIRSSSLDADSKLLNGNSSHSNNQRNKSSQISANKLLEMFNNDITSSNTLKRRSSLASKLSSVNSIDDLTDSVKIDGDEYDYNDTELLKELEKNSISYNDEFFDSDIFQDINKVFGFDSEFIAEVCSPDREMCNTSFEFTVDNLCFLGLPIHSDKDGNWRTSKNKSNRKSAKTSSTHSKGSRRHSINSKESTSKTNEDENIESSENHDDEDDKSYMNPIAMHDLNSPDYEKNMNMFHVCFVMNPPISEYNQRVDDMYHYIVMRLAHTLKILQAKSFYVSKEVEILLKEKEYVLKSSRVYKNLKGAANKGQYLYQRLLVQSSLARALVTCFDTIHKNDIVNLTLDEKVVTLQIPIHDEFWKLPQYKIEPVLRGSHLTSILNYGFLKSTSTKNKKKDINSNNFADDDNIDNDILNYALLLKEEQNVIIEKLKSFSQDDNIGGLILRQLVKHIQPNVPIRSYQPLINELMGVKENDPNRTIFHINILKYCALHLLYWRHARAVIPLSSKYTYIVSPLSPLVGSSKDYISEGSSHFSFNRREDNHYEPLFYQHQIEFGQTFPSLPSLVSFLSLLSNGKPRPFGTIIPSKEHKPIYLGALAWLIRSGYLTQLLTYVCIRIDSQIKMEVDEDLEREGFKMNSKKSKENVHKNEVQIDNIVAVKKNQSYNNRFEPSSTNDESRGNAISEIAMYEERLQFAFDDLELEKDYTIILEPEKAGAIERRWIVKCVHDQPADVQILFNRLLKYFNGKVPMEVVALKENLTKHEIKKVMHAMNKYLIEIKHW